MTIPRNHTKRIAAIRAAATTCRVYTLENYFNGADCDPTYAWKQLEKFNFAKLSENGPGHWSITVHSNCWYELRASS